MPFFVRPFRRFPVCCATMYHVGDVEGRGTHSLEIRKESKDKLMVKKVNGWWRGEI